MKKLTNKSKISTIALILLLTISAIVVALPTATAQPPGPFRKQTYAFLGAVPNPVGVDQTVLLHIGIFHPTPGLGYSWEDLTVTVTKPDSTTETLGPFSTDSTGGTGALFTPTNVGTYILQAHFPEQVNPITFFLLETFTPVFAGTVMEASSSEILELVVQEEPIEYYPGVPLPTEYWSRPIDAQLREWSPIAGNWLRRPGPGDRGVIAPYNKGPESAHILWAKPLTTGGLAGGATGDHGMESGDAYEGKFENSVIINGVLYYNRYASGREPQQGIIALDLHTGEELWFRNNTRLAFGQNFYFSSWNYHGVFDYLWETKGSTWNAYNPFNGEWVYSMTDVPSGYFYYGPNGEIYILTVDVSNSWMALWNSTEAGQYGLSGNPRGSWGNHVHGRTINATNGYSWNKTIPTGLAPPVQQLLREALKVFPDDRVVGVGYNTTEVNVWGLSLKPGQEGQLLFDTTWQPPAEWDSGKNIIKMTGATTHGEGGVLALFSKELRRHYGFSLDTGSFLWETESEHYLQSYIAQTWAFAYDKLYSTGVSGILYCYDAQTGKTLWTYHAEDPYQEFLVSNDWWGNINFITDGKVYMGHEEHAPIDPKPRGAPFICLDAETGDVIWKAEGMFRQGVFGGLAIIGDSIIATMDTYDQRIYAIGKGPSAITVEAPLLASTLGSTVTIRGTVTDISPGTQEYAIAARFPNGVPAVADASMNDWMLYVYKQFPKPDDVTGVPVTLEAIDPNGNYQNIGTATSDAFGNYGFTFEPEVSGQYLIMATFYGSDSYYGSTTTTYLTVDPTDSEVVIPPYPGYQGPSASEVAQNVLDNLPDDPTASDIAQEVKNKLEIPEATVIPEYTTIDLIIIVAVAISIVIGYENANKPTTIKQFSLPFFGSKTSEETGLKRLKHKNENNPSVSSEGFS